MRWIEVEPAYGRDYKTQAEVKEAWKAGKDFRMTDTGQYINDEDCRRHLETEGERLGVNVRYANSRKIVTVTR